MCNKQDILSLSLYYIRVDSCKTARQKLITMTFTSHELYIYKLRLALHI